MLHQSNVLRMSAMQYQSNVHGASVNGVIVLWLWLF